MNETIPDTLNKAWKNDKSAFGYKMLQRMGWSENKGLGKNEDGITVNLKVSKRETGLGLGSEEIDGAGNKGWSETATSFNQVLDVLKSTYSNEIKKSKKVKAKNSKSNVIIPVGMKYKKMQAAKDFSTKSDKEKKAILGAALVVKTNNINDDDDDDDDRSKHKKSKKDKKEKKKSKKSKKKDDDDNDNDNDNNDNNNDDDNDTKRPRTRSMSTSSNNDDNQETDNKKTNDNNDNIKKKKKIKRNE